MAKTHCAVLQKAQKVSFRMAVILLCASRGCMFQRLGEKSELYTRMKELKVRVS